MGQSVQSINLDEGSLTKAVSKYNKCKDVDNIIYKAKKPMFAPKFGISIGLNISNLNFSSNDSSAAHLTSGFDLSSSVQYGISFELMSPRISKRLSVLIEFNYLSSLYTSFSKIELATSNNIQWNDVTIELGQLKIPFGIRYKLIAKKFGLYANAGISSTIHLRSDYYRLIERERQNVVLSSSSTSLIITQKQFGTWAGFGLSRAITGKLSGSLELRYERTNGIIEPTQVAWSIFANSLYSEISNFQFILRLTY